MRVRRRLTTKHTRYSNVLPKKRHRNAFPPMPGDDPLIHRPLLPASEYPSAVFAHLRTEAFHAYWMALHALTFLVPKFRRSAVGQEGLANIAHFFRHLPLRGIMGCHECTKHYMEFTNLSAIGRGGQDFFIGMVNDEDPYLLARWLCNLHNSVHRNRAVASAANGSMAEFPIRDEVPFDTVRTYYERSVYAAGNAGYTIVEAYLRSEFGIKLREDMLTTEIAQGTDRPVQQHYIDSILKRLKPILPHGARRHHWHQLRRIDETSVLVPSVHTAAGAVCIVLYALIRHMLVCRALVVRNRAHAAPLGKVAAAIMLCVYVVAQRIAHAT